MTGVNSSDREAFPLPDRRLGDILRDGSGAGRMCFIGGDAVPPIYARTDDSILEGYGAALCITFAALEQRLLEKRSRTAGRPQQIIERIDFDSHGRIAVTTVALLTLEEGSAHEQSVIAEMHGTEPVRLRSGSFEPITESQAADSGTAEYILWSPGRREDSHVYRVTKRLLNRTEWSYNDEGVAERRIVPVQEAVLGGMRA